MSSKILSQVTFTFIFFVYFSCKTSKQFTSSFKGTTQLIEKCHTGKCVYCSKGNISVGSNRKMLKNCYHHNYFINTVDINILIIPQHSYVKDKLNVRICIDIKINCMFVYSAIQRRAKKQHPLFKAFVVEYVVEFMLKSCLKHSIFYH